MAKAPRFEGYDRDTPLDAAARILVSSLASEALGRLPGALRGDDVRAVHDARVALRRLRAAMQTFGTCFPHKRWSRQQRVTRRVARALGGVRDADVHLAALRGLLGGAQAQERAGVAYAIEALGARRRSALGIFAVELSQFDREGLTRTIADA